LLPCVAFAAEKLFQRLISIGASRAMVGVSSSIRSCSRLRSTTRNSVWSAASRSSPRRAWWWQLAPWPWWCSSNIQARRCYPPPETGGWMIPFIKTSMSLEVHLRHSVFTPFTGHCQELFLQKKNAGKCPLQNRHAARTVLMALRTSSKVKGLARQRRFSCLRNPRICSLTTSPVMKTTRWQRAGLAVRRFS
jgi:hypothetical protein